ncbi:homeobox KN domain protein [Ceratobasidium sp. AG-Ba]|nr:homeobox KN domain protein [Ceratobasidium sp. AG-Ba]
MNACSADAGLIQQLQSLEAQFSSAISAGTNAHDAFSGYLDNTLAQAHRLVQSGQASLQLTHVLSGVLRSLETMCRYFVQLQEYPGFSDPTKVAQDLVMRAGLRRRRKRSTRKSKAGKNGRVRQSGKKSKRGHKSPVGNGKRRVRVEDEASGSKKKKSSDNSKKSRTVTAPPTDSMKFGPCRDFFLNHLGDPYPTTVQKHQILKQSSPDFTLRSLNLWFVNIRRRSGWMNIFKKHAASKREAMRDLVARVEAQVAGRPAPNPLPSGATPPGFKVEQEIVDEIMAMRAVVDMVSREVYGEGWDQILQIKPWTEEEVRAHEERKKAARREARAAKADGDKRRKERGEHREQRKKDKDLRKRVEQETVESIRAARELHAKIMAANKRKRDDDDESTDGPAKKAKNDNVVDTKIRVPKVDENGDPLTKEQRKALKKAMLAAQAQPNPLKRKSPEPESNTTEFDDVSASKRRRRDAATFDGFPSTEDAPEGAPMPDLSQLFSMQWASPPAPAAPLPPVETTPPPVSGSGYGEFAHPADNQVSSMPPPPPPMDTSSNTAGEVPRRFSQQLAAFALESGMFDGEHYELFSEDTFPGISVDVHSDNAMNSLMPPPAGHASNPMPHASGSMSHSSGSMAHTSNTMGHNSNSMSVSPVQTDPHTPIPSFAAPIQPQGYDSFAPPNQPPVSPYTIATPTQPNPDMDSDMSWIHDAMARLPSEHDVQYDPEQASYSQGFVAEPNSYAAPGQQQRAPPVSHQRTQVSYPSPQPQPQQQRSMPPPPAPSVSPVQTRQQTFPHPKTRPPVPSPPRHRAPGGLWQTPYSQPPQPQQQYQQPAPSFPSPAATRPPSRSFPAPQQYNDQGYERHNSYSQPPDHSPVEREYQPHYPPPPPPQSHYSPSPAPAPAPEPIQDPVAILKQHELEFARAQEELQNRFKREQEEQLARFMRAQEDLKRQLMINQAGGRS